MTDTAPAPEKKRRKKGTSPTARTLKMLRDRGQLAQVVERFNMYTKQYTDLFGVIDIVVAAGMGGIQGWQATSGDNLASRLTKAIAEPRLAVWLASGASFYAVGWRQIGAHGDRKLWKPRIVELRLRDGEVVRVDDESQEPAQDGGLWKGGLS